MTDRKNRKLLFIVVLTVAMLLAVTSIAMANVWTDQADYVPGSVVTISGDNSNFVAPNGYQYGETVHVDVVGPNDYTASCQGVPDDLGAWTCQVTLWASDLAVGNYSYTATGLTSGVSESGTFTDASNTENVSFATNGLPSGTTVSVSYSGKNPGGGSQSGTTSFNASGPSAGIGFQGESIIRCTFPSSFTIGSSTYNLSAQPCGVSGTTLPAASSPTHTTIFTGVYALAAPTDTTPPVITYVLNPATPDGLNGWYKSDVTLTWTVTENESPASLIKTGCVDQNITVDQAATDYSCSATSDGGTADPVLVTIKRDATPPAITVTPDRDPDSNGWYNALVSFTVTGVDTTSDNVVCDDPIDYSGPDSATASITGHCTDEAGNEGSAISEFQFDATAPDVTLTPDRDPNSNGWYNALVSFTVSGEDATSDNVICDDPIVYSGPDSNAASVTGYCTDEAGNEGSATAEFKYDATAPTVTVTPDRLPDHNGWYNAPVLFDTKGTDATSGVSDANCTADQTYSTPDGTGLTVSGSCTDNAGNVGDGTSASFDFDDTNPSLSWVGGPANGASYYFGFVPTAPTCTAADTLSGPDGCTVTGYGTTVGFHTMTAAALDVAGNSYSESRSYTVLAWTLNGFFPPVDMPYKDGGGNLVIVLNTVKNGSTVPLKFRIYAGATELTNTEYITSLTYGLTVCDANAPQDAIETTTTGGTSLRYDTTSGQFIFNWKTPNTAGKCYVVTLTTDDGSTLVAFFKLK